MAKMCYNIFCVYLIYLYMETPNRNRQDWEKWSAPKTKPKTLEEQMAEATNKAAAEGADALFKKNLTGVRVNERTQRSNPDFDYDTNDSTIQGLELPGAGSKSEVSASSTEELQDQMKRMKNWKPDKTVELGAATGTDDEKFEVVHGSDQFDMTG
jgi:hypothetical protein